MVFVAVEVAVCLSSLLSTPKSELGNFPWFETYFLAEHDPSANYPLNPTEGVGPATTIPCVVCSVCGDSGDLSAGWQSSTRKFSGK